LWNAYTQIVIFWAWGFGFPRCLPQDVFFGINRDICPPLLVALALLLLFDAMREGVSSYFDLIAGAILSGNGISHGCIELRSVWKHCAVALCASVVERSCEEGAVQKEFAMILAAPSPLYVPPALWVARNRLVNRGNLTGLKAKIAYRVGP